MWRYAFLLAGMAPLSPAVLVAQSVELAPEPPRGAAMEPVGEAMAAALADPAGALGRPDLIDTGRGIAAGAFAAGPAGACMECHGMDGRGQAAAGFPRLAGQGSIYMAETLADFADGRRRNAVMTPIAKALTVEQMVAVSAYYASVDAPPMALQPTPVSPEDLQYGGALAAIGNARTGVQGCINCHGPEGAGLPPAYPYLVGQTAEYLAHQLRAWKSGERSGDPQDIMAEISRRLTDEDIRAVSAYYASISGGAVAPVAVNAGGEP